MNKNFQQQNDPLQNLVNSKKKGDLIVLVFANFAYLEVLLNWLIAMHRLDIRNYVVISLDQKIHDYLTEKGFPSFLSAFEGNLDDLWIRRMEIFRTLTLSGTHFIHSDADALWLKNPIPEYFSKSPYQLIASQGTIWPPDILQKRGFVLCCGLFYLQSHPQTVALLDRMIVDVRNTKDDQITMNRLIEVPDMKWHIDQPGSYKISFQNQQFLCSTNIIEGDSQSIGLKVGVLPHHLFQRLHMPQHKAYVKHLFAPKTCRSKMQLFAETDSLFLNSNWKQIEFDADLIEKIAV